jgi:hypothetical protein
MHKRALTAQESSVKRLVVFIGARDPLLGQTGSAHKSCEPAIQPSRFRSGGQRKRIAAAVVSLLTFWTGLRRGPPDNAFLFESNDLDSPSGDCHHSDRIWPFPLR